MAVPGVTPVKAPGFFHLATRSFWLLFGGAFLVTGIVLTSVGAAIAWREALFAADGAAAEGVVLGRAIRGADGDENRSTEYHVSYRFSTPDGTVIDGTDEVAFNRWDSLVEGRPVSITYLVEDPGQNRPAGSDDGIVSVIVLGVGVVALGGGLATSGWAVRRLLITHRLWRDGVAIEGVVVRVEPANVTFNNRPLFRVRYEYGDVAGQRHAGTSGLIAWEEAEGWQPGDRGAVRYDPRRPELSAWVGEPPGAQALS